MFCTNVSISRSCQSPCLSFPLSRAAVCLNACPGPCIQTYVEAEQQVCNNRNVAHKGLCNNRSVHRNTGTCNITRHQGSSARSQILVRRTIGAQNFVCAVSCRNCSRPCENFNIYGYFYTCLDRTAEKYVVLSAVWHVAGHHKNIALSTDSEISPITDTLLLVCVGQSSVSEMTSWRRTRC